MEKDWISIDKEREVLRLLRLGKLSRRRIALRVGVGNRTVSRIAGGRKRKSRDMEPCDGIVNLLEPRLCPQCRALVVQWPCPTCFPSVDTDDIGNEVVVDEDTLVEEAPELLKIVTDLHELHALRLIPHLLFVDLARRARECLSRIWSKK
jgi:predicted DNA-binding protein (UPF0251 family)